VALGRTRGRGGGGLRDGADGSWRRARAERYAAREPKQTTPGGASPCGEAPGLLLDDRKVAMERVEHGGVTRFGGGTVR
jgi:hypothetical protein